MSDIHGNRPALERALAEFRRRGVDRVAVLGDNLGRGDSDGCVAVIRKFADISVVGNRDLDWHRRVSAESAAYVLALPRTARADGIAFSHGDVRLTRDLATDGVRDGFRRARAWLAAHDCHVWFFGHSHRARVWSVADAKSAPTLLFDAATHALPAHIAVPHQRGRSGAAVIINAGSVGLPFAGKGPASALVYDDDAQVVDIIPL